MPNDLIPETGTPPTPRPRLLWRIETSLGIVVPLRPCSLRFCHRGEQFEEGDQLLEALDHGLYARYLVQGHPDTPTQYTWTWLRHLDALSDLITPILDQMTPYQREVAMVDMVFQAAMMSLRRAPGAVRPDLQNPIHAEGGIHDPTDVCHDQTGCD